MNNQNLHSRIRDCLYGMLPYLLLFGIPLVLAVVAFFGQISLNTSKANQTNDKEYRTYDAGYEEGLSVGQENGYDEGYNEGYNNGYEIGRDERYDFGWYFEEKAIDYVREHNQWHPEEALMIIEAYQNNEPFYQDGSPPSEHDYNDAIESLMLFYDYFYSSKYK